MPGLEIRLFGEFAIVETESATELSLPHGAQALLGYLLLNRRTEHPRDDLSQIFWPEEDSTRARSRLNTAIWRLRKALAAGNVNPDDYIISRPSGEVAFNRASRYWLDIEVFEEASTVSLGTARGTPSSFDPEALEAAVRLYQGDVLRGFYSDWALRERERLSDLHIRSLMRLVEYHRLRGDLAKSVEFARMAVAREPLREDIHRDLIALYAAQGQRAMALQQYKTCKAILETELGVGPMPETDATLEQALTGRASVGAAQVSDGRREASVSARELRMLRDKLAQATRLLEEVKASLEDLDQGGE